MNLTAIRPIFGQSPVLQKSTGHPRFASSFQQEMNRMVQVATGDFPRDPDVVYRHASELASRMSPDEAAKGQFILSSLILHKLHNHRASTPTSCR